MKYRHTWQKAILVSLVAVTSLYFTGCYCKPSLSGSVGVPGIPQERDWWCWAATGEMISHYYNHVAEQCSSVMAIKGASPDCCTGCSGNCDCWGGAWGASIQDIKDMWAHWNYSYSYKASELSWDSLKIVISTNQYCCSSPIQVIWWWTGGGGHVVTAYGYMEAGGEQYVAYKDPWPPNCEETVNGCSAVEGGDDVVTTYAAFEGSANHDWGNSFYKFKFTGE